MSSKALDIKNPYKDLLDNSHVNKGLRTPTAKKIAHKRWLAGLCCMNLIESASAKSGFDVSFARSLSGAIGLHGVLGNTQVLAFSDPNVDIEKYMIINAYK